METVLSVLLIILFLAHLIIIALFIVVLIDEFGFFDEFDYVIDRINCFFKTICNHSKKR